MRLKELRKNRKETQQELANYLNTTQQTYARYELETSEPTIESLIRLAEHYDVTLDYLVGREFRNGIGYLNENQKNCVTIITQLNEINLMKATSYMLGLLATQN